MTSIGIVQVLVFFAIGLVITKPIGTFMYRVFEGDRTFLQPVMRPLERLIYRLTGVREDVEHVRSTTWPSGGDDYRLDRTMEELNELQSKLANHVYDERELDEVITALGRVASYNRMAPRDRDILTDDVARMREYRERHADWDRDRDRER